MEKYSARISELHTQLCELLSKKARTIHDIIRERPSEFNVYGVYVISTPNDRDIVYVGRTKLKSVIGRVEDHRIRNGKSDLNVLLKNSPNHPQDINHYLVRCVEVSDPIKRKYLEYFLISILQPLFNK